MGAAHFGLGLAVAADVVQAHGAAIELSNLEDIQGNICGAGVKLNLPLMNQDEIPTLTRARTKSLLFKH